MSNYYLGIAEYLTIKTLIWCKQKQFMVKEDGIIGIEYIFLVQSFYKKWALLLRITVSCR